MVRQRSLVCLFGVFCMSLVCLWCLCLFGVFCISLVCLRCVFCMSRARARKRACTHTHTQHSYARVDDAGGLGSTLIGYLIQGSLKYGCFEIFKPLAFKSSPLPPLSLPHCPLVPPPLPPSPSPDPCPFPTGPLSPYPPQLLTPIQPSFPPLSPHVPSPPTSPSSLLFAQAYHTHEHAHSHLARNPLYTHLNIPPNSAHVTDSRLLTLALAAGLAEILGRCLCACVCVPVSVCLCLCVCLCACVCLPVPVSTSTSCMAVSVSVCVCICV